MKRVWGKIGSFMLAVCMAVSCCCVPASAAGEVLAGQEAGSAAVSAGATGVSYNAALRGVGAVQGSMLPETVINAAGTGMGSDKAEVTDGSMDNMESKSSPDSEEAPARENPPVEDYTGAVQDSATVQLQNQLVAEERANVGFMTVAGAGSKLSLSALRAKFPNGKYWNHAGNPGSSNSKNNQNGYTSTPCSKHGVVGTSQQTCNGFQPGSTQLSWQCMGYAEKLGYDSTGYNPRNNANGWYTYTSSSALNNLKAGDIVRFKNGGHSIFVTAVNGDTVTYTDCNSDGHCIIRWDKTISKSTLRATFTHLRSSPGITIGQDSCNCSTSYAGNYTCTSSSTLYIRSGHGTSYGVLGSIPSKATVSVSKANGTWAHVTYNGVSGYSSMQYLSKQSQGSATIKSSLSEVSLKVPSDKKRTVKLTAGGTLPSVYNMAITSATGSGYSAGFVGGWIDNVSTNIEITGTEAGSGEITVALRNGNTQQVVATVKIKITVKEDTSTLKVSSSAVSLNLPGTSSKKVTLTAGGFLPSLYNLTIDAKTGSGYDAGFVGDWSGSSHDLEITGTEAGGGEITVSLRNANTKKILASAKIKVTVTAPASLSSSASQISLRLPDKPESKITLTAGGTLPSSYYLNCSTSGSGFSTSWDGDWYDGRKHDLKVRGTGKGSGTITIKLMNQSTGETLARTSISVTVTSVEYTLTYDAAGGSGAPNAQSGMAGTSMTVSGTVPKKFAGDFLGWSTRRGAVSAEYLPGASLRLDADTTLYAVWGRAKEIQSSSLPAETDAAVTIPGTTKYFSFTPVVSGEYAVSSLGNQDTVGWLYDSSGKLLKNNDDGAGNRNFLLEYTLTAGRTYYICAGLYYSSASGSFKIAVSRKKTDLSSGFEISPVRDQIYTGEAITPEVTVKSSEKSLRAGTDYEVSYSNNINAGTAEVTVRGTGDYTGTLHAGFKINPVDLSECTVESIPEQTYKGTSVTPFVTVRWGTKLLRENMDYTVSYENNNRPGTAVARIKGKGNFEGKISINYRIIRQAETEPEETEPQKQETERQKETEPQKQETERQDETEPEDFEDEDFDEEDSDDADSDEEEPEDPAFDFEEGMESADSSGKAYYEVTNIPETGMPEVVYEMPVREKTTVVVIPDTVVIDGVTCRVTAIAAGAFRNNRAVRKVIIGNQVTVIGTKAFFGCTKLKSVTLGKKLEKISAKAFASCQALQSITIPEKVRIIGNQAFYHCKKLRKITIRTNLLSGKNVGSKAFKGIYAKAVVKVPRKVMSAYKKLLRARGLGKKTVWKKL